MTPTELSKFECYIFEILVRQFDNILVAWDIMKLQHLGPIISLSNRNLTHIDSSYRVGHPNHANQKYHGHLEQEMLS